MCGIAGIVDYEGRFGSAELLRIATRMRDTLTHRGPDDAGVWIDPTGVCALAHRRLSIFDLSEKGRQPPTSSRSIGMFCFTGKSPNRSRGPLRWVSLACSCSSALGCSKVSRASLAIFCDRGYKEN